MRRVRWQEKYRIAKTMSDKRQHSLEQLHSSTVSSQAELKQSHEALAAARSQVQKLQTAHDELKTQHAYESGQLKRLGDQKRAAEEKAHNLERDLKQLRKQFASDSDTKALCGQLEAELSKRQKEVHAAEDEKDK